MAVTSAQATIAARMERVPLFSLHRKLVFVLGVGTFFDLFDIALGGLLAAILANIYHLNAFQTAAIIASGFFGMFVGAAVLSVVSDYFCRRTMFLIDLLIYSLFSLRLLVSMASARWLHVSWLPKASVSSTRWRLRRPLPLGIPWDHCSRFPSSSVWSASGSLLELHS